MFSNQSMMNSVHGGVGFRFKSSPTEAPNPQLAFLRTSDWVAFELVATTNVRDVYTTPYVNIYGKKQ